jgi:hypothetical protein
MEVERTNRLAEDLHRSGAEDCYADLNPALTVTVRYFAACSPINSGPLLAVGRGAAALGRLGLP